MRRETNIKKKKENIEKGISGLRSKLVSVVLICVCFVGTVIYNVSDTNASGDVCYIGSQGYATLQAAAAAAISGDTIRVVQDVDVSTPIDIVGKNLTFVGDSSGITIKRAADINVFAVVGSSAFSLENITVDGGAVWSDSSFTAQAAETRTNSGLTATSSLISTRGGNSTINLKAGAILQNADLHSVDDVAIGAMVTLWEAGSTLNMYDGSIIQLGAASYSGTGGNLSGGVTNNGDTIFNMYGGAIRGCSAIDNDANSGAAVFCRSDGSNSAFNMMGSANIYGNYNNVAGAVLVRYGTFKMEGNSRISNNKGNSSGGVFLYRNASMDMRGSAKIDSNISNQGGGIVNSRCVVNIGENAEISNNIGTDKAGGIYNSGGTLKISGNTGIYNNSANTNGGGIYSTGGTVEMTGGYIKGNSAENYGAGIYVSGTGNFIMRSGNNPKIYGNLAGMGADDVFADLRSGTVTLIPVAYMGIPQNMNASDWYYDNDNARYRNSDAVKTIYDETQLNNVVTAKLTIGLTYNVDFDSQGGSPVNRMRYVGYNAKINQPPAPQKNGFVFAGWYKDQATTVPWDFNTDTVTDSITLYAKWDIARYTVTYDSKGGNSVAPEMVNVGMRVTKPADPTRTGYTFGGWYIDQNYSTQWNFDRDTVTRDMVLYAKWTAKATDENNVKPTDKIVKTGDNTKILLYVIVVTTSLLLIVVLLINKRKKNK